MADDIRSRAGLGPREEAARRRDGEARRAAAREALTQEQMRERTMKEMEARRAAPPARSGPNRIPPSPRPSSVTPVDRLPPGRIPEPPRPSTVSSAGSAPVTRSIAGAVGRRALGLPAVLIPDDSLRAGADFEQRELARAREQVRSREQAEPADDPAAGSMQNARPARSTARPRPRPARRAAREEITTQELNDMVLEQLRGRRSQPSTMPMAQARDNIELAMGRDTQPEIGSVQREDFRRGGMIAAKPKKAAPKKPMPFKKGGAIKMKGKK